MSESTYIHVGRAVKPHGIRGGIKVAGPWGFEGLFQPGDRIHFAADPDPPARREEAQLAALAGTRSFALARMGRMGKFLLLHLEGLTDRETAESLRGREVYGPLAALDRMRRDRWHPQDLMGLRVNTPQGRPLGVVEAVFNTGANDILSVRSDDGMEYLLPVAPPFMIEVDLAGRRLVYDPPEGLLELYESPD